MGKHILDSLIDLSSKIKENCLLSIQVQVPIYLYKGLLSLFTGKCCVKHKLFPLSNGMGNLILFNSTYSYVETPSNPCSSCLSSEHL